MPRLPLCALLLGMTVFVVCVGTAGSVRADYVVEGDYGSTFTRVPDKTDALWEKIGTGPVLMLGDDGLLLNDNDPTVNVAYQGLLGRLEARHRVTVRAEMSVLSNIGGDAAVLEVARPGLEVRLRLYRDRIDLVERSGRGETRWLGSASVDLTSARELVLVKGASTADEGECVRVLVDGQQLLHCRPQADGSLGVGRVAFGSLSYSGLGASLWKSIEVRLEVETATGAATPVEDTSFGELKGRFLR